MAGKPVTKKPRTAKAPSKRAARSDKGPARGSRIKRKQTSADVIDKDHLIDAIQAGAAFTKKAAKDILAAILDTITVSLKKKKIEKFQIVVGIIVSIATVFIVWKTFELSERTSANNDQLKAIEQQLAKSRFGFEQIRDVYDRTERYLASSKQNESRGRVLVVLINSLPDSSLRTELLAVVTEEAKSDTVAAQAANLLVSDMPDVSSGTVDASSFFGDRSIVLEPGKFEARTVAEFGFIDSSGASWTVPARTVLTGASLPRVFWSVVGPPLTSDYSIALMLHEHYSTTRTRPWRDVNKMFYEALSKSGVSEANAKTLYHAVQSFGPRWADSGSD